MNKVLVTEQHLIDIAEAVRLKLNSDEKMLLKDVAIKILDIPTGAGGDATTYRVDIGEAGEGQSFVVLCDGVQKKASFSAEKGSIIAASVVNDEGYVAGKLSIDGGKMFPDLSYSLVGDMAISATPATKQSGGGELIKSIVINAKSDGSLKGYTLARLEKCIPNKSRVRFELVLFCPPGVTLDSDGMALSDFANGRHWGNANSYVGRNDYVTQESALGTTYTLAWTEDINTTEYLWDDDKNNDLLTYYLCSETSVNGANAGKATLTFNVYSV